MLPPLLRFACKVQPPSLSSPVCQCQCVHVFPFELSAFFWLSSLVISSANMPRMPTLALRRSSSQSSSSAKNDSRTLTCGFVSRAAVRCRRCMPSVRQSQSRWWHITKSTWTNSQRRKLRTHSSSTTVPFSWPTHVDPSQRSSAVQDLVLDTRNHTDNRCVHLLRAFYRGGLKKIQ